MKCHLGLVLLLGLSTMRLVGQGPGTAQPAVTQKLTFDVASLRENKSGYPPTGDVPSTNMALGPGDVYNPTGGFVSIRNYPLIQFFTFSYKLTNSQVLDLFGSAPDWVKRTQLDLQARTDKPNVTKDELRLMMQSLLAERFGLVAHFGTKNQSVLAMRLVKPGTLGPRLRAHSPAETCSRLAPVAAQGGPPPPVTLEGGFPIACGGMLVLPTSTPKEWHVGGRDVSLASMAGDFGSWGRLDRTVVDETGLKGNYDFALDFVPKRPEPPPGATVPPEEQEPNFVEALRKQLGLKLDSEKHDVQILVIDQIHPLSDN